MKRYERLEKLIKENGYSKIAEIGVDEGETTRYLIQQCVLTKYILVDPYISPSLYVMVSQLPYAEFFGNKSQTVFGMIPDGSLDLVYIDGDHSYEGVEIDITGWMPKVRKGGILCGHDLQSSHPAVKEVVEKHFGKDYEHDETCAMWWVKV